MSVENGRRIARFKDMTIRGVGVTDDRNGPFDLVMRVDGAGGTICLNTHVWTVEWEPAEDFDGSIRGSSEHAD